MHARKTRQRKKAKMNELAQTRKELEEEHKMLKQAINERKTAKILLVMSASGSSGGGSNPREFESCTLEVSSDEEHADDCQPMDCGNGAMSDGESVSDGSMSDGENDKEDGGERDGEKGTTSGEYFSSGSNGNGNGINLALLEKDSHLCTQQELEQKR